MMLLLRYIFSPELGLLISLITKNPTSYIFGYQKVKLISLRLKEVPHPLLKKEILKSNSDIFFYILK